MSEKRPATDLFTSSQLVKRQKSDTNLGNGSSVAIVNGSTRNGALIPSVQRTSRLQVPIVELQGHSGEIFAARFDPSGQYIASGSMDRTILLWRTYGNCENYGILNGHKGAVLDIQWSRNSRTIFTASADMIIASWDVETGTRMRRHSGHEEVINCIDLSRRGEELITSGSDDGYIGMWDPRQKEAIYFIETDFPVTAVALSEAGNELYSGGIDNDIKVWDVRKKAVTYSLFGHTDNITSLAVSPDSQTLLSNSHDGTVRTWDIRPFAPTDRHIKIFDGASTGMDRYLQRSSWDAKGQRIVAGSGDGSVVMWDNHSGKLLYKLPGHRGSVNDVHFSPIEESIILSASVDRMMILGELSK